MLWKKQIICVLFGVLFSILFTGIMVHGKESVLQRQVAAQVLRFHVLANSDSEADQALKLQVKERILSMMQEELPEEGLEAVKTWVKDHRGQIEHTAKQVVRENGYDYEVHVELKESSFPDKTYGDITFPAGTYEALRIEIGEAQGKNWWCVLYPNLCFLNAVHAVVPEEGKQELKEVLDEEAYEMITTKTTFRIKWFFF